MQVKIQVIATAIDTKQGAKNSYQQLEVTYKDLDKNKVASKKIMSFSKPESVFKTMATAKPTDVYDVELVKNEQSGYWDWTNVTKSVSTVTETGQSGARTAGVSTLNSKSGGWETPEERAKKQIYIIRQSSLSTAVTALSVNAKVNPKAEEIIELARQFEAYVFESDSAQAVARKDVGTIETMDEDIPY